MLAKVVAESTEVRADKPGTGPGLLREGPPAATRALRRRVGDSESTFEPVGEVELSPVEQRRGRRVDDCCEARRAGRDDPFDVSDLVLGVEVHLIREA